MTQTDVVLGFPNNAATSPWLCVTFFIVFNPPDTHVAHARAHTHTSPHTHAHSPFAACLAEQHNVKDQRSLPGPNPPKIPPDVLTWFESMPPAHPLTEPFQ